MLELKNISKKFKNSVIFESISINFEKGKIYLITGPNGSGKTTLLKILTGYIIPDKGEIYFKKRRLNFEKYDFNLFSFIPDTPYFYPQITVLENIIFFLRNRNIKFDIGKFKKISEILNFKNPEIEKKFSFLSNGNKFKSMIIRSFMENAPVLLIDEGFKFLDNESFRSVKSFLKEEFVKEKTIIIATNDTKIFSDISDEIFTIKNKNIVKEIYVK